MDVGNGGGQELLPQHPKLHKNAVSLSQLLQFSGVGHPGDNCTCPSSTALQPRRSRGSHPPDTRSDQAHGGTSGGNSRTCSWPAGARSTLRTAPWSHSWHTPATGAWGCGWPLRVSGPHVPCCACPCVCSGCLSQCPCCVPCLCPSVHAVTLCPMSLCLSQCPCCLPHPCLSQCPRCVPCPCVHSVSYVCPSVLAVSHVPVSFHVPVPRPCACPRAMSRPGSRSHPPRGPALKGVPGSGAGARPAGTSDEGDRRLDDIAEDGLEEGDRVGHRRSTLDDRGAGRRHLVRLPVPVLRHGGGGGGTGGRRGQDGGTAHSGGAAGSGRAPLRRRRSARCMLGDVVRVLLRPQPGVISSNHFG